MLSRKIFEINTKILTVSFGIKYFKILRFFLRKFCSIFDNLKSSFLKSQLMSLIYSMSITQQAFMDISSETTLQYTVDMVEGFYTTERTTMEE